LVNFCLLQSILEEESDALEEEEEMGEEEEGVETEEVLIQKKLQRKAPHPVPEEAVKLTKEMAGDCLTMLGKTGNAIEYAYLKIKAINL
jgi:hypothetical protein